MSVQQYGWLFPGFLTRKELGKLNSYKLPYDRNWVPISWSVTHVMNARRAEIVRNDMEANKLIDASVNFPIHTHSSVVKNHYQLFPFSQLF